MYLGRKVGLFRSNAEFAVRVVRELGRDEGECVLRTEDEYCKHTRSKGPLIRRVDGLWETDFHEHWRFHFWYKTMMVKKIWYKKISGIKKLIAYNFLKNQYFSNK